MPKTHLNREASQQNFGFAHRCGKCSHSQDIANASRVQHRLDTLSWRFFCVVISSKRYHATRLFWIRHVRAVPQQYESP